MSTYKPTKHQRAARRSRRRGMAAVIAMLYLTLFSALAVGFYSASSLNGQISRNQKQLELAQAAADAGTQFMRYQLGVMNLPTINTATLLQDVATALGNQLNGTTNMNGNTVQVTGSGPSAAIYIPAPPSSGQWMVMDPTLGTQFRAMIQQSGQFLTCSVDGAGAGTTVTRAILVKYHFAPKAGAILNYGVATQGTVSTSGSTVIQGQTDPSKGSILSTDMTSSTPVSINGQAVSGDISIVNPSGNVSVGGASIGGTSNPALIPQHIHKGVPMPTFPTVDVSVFTQYATTLYDGSGTCTNCYIPPNTNPKFNGGTINGVLWIQSPNVVTFRGNTTINGVIVNDQQANKFDPANNVISFAGNVQASPISSTSFAGENQLTGAFLIAPSFSVNMTGNFGTIGGSIVAGQISMSGNAGGTVQGTVIGMTDNPITLGGNSSITIASTGTSNYPSGLSFGNYYAPLPGTYIEVTPW